MMLELTELYGIICAAMALLLILVQGIRRIAWVARQRLGSLFIKYLVLPLVFPRARFLGNITWLRFCLQLTYLATNIVTNVLGVRSLHDASVKSATLSIVNFSLLLASQPALIADLMGLSLRTYLRIHGMVSLVTSAQVLTHFIILVAEKQVSISGTQLYGLMATATIGLLLIFLCLRRPFYEFFIKSHHVLAIGSFFMIWRHISIENTFARYYLLGGAATFVMTLVAHITFLLAQNISLHRPLPRATIKPYSGAVKLRVTNIRPFKVRAGQFFQLRIPGISIWSLFQSHPFIVAWWDEDEQGCATSLYFLIEARGGFTEKLSRSASLHDTYLTWVDGPYNNSTDLREYGCALMIASGVGIAAQIPYIKEILKQRRQWRSSIRKICLAWEIHNSSQLDWVVEWMQELLRQDQGGYVLHISLFMPNRSNTPEKYGIHERIEILPQEMNVNALIDEEVHARSGKMVVTVASRHKIRDEARFAVMRCIGNIGIHAKGKEILAQSNPDPAVYIKSIERNTEDLIRTFHNKRTKNSMNQKVEALIHTIHMFHRYAFPTLESDDNRVQSLHFIELPFQPGQGSWTPPQIV